LFLCWYWWSTPFMIVMFFSQAILIYWIHIQFLFFKKFCFKVIERQGCNPLTISTCHINTTISSAILLGFFLTQIYVHTHVRACMHAHIFETGTFCVPMLAWKLLYNSARWTQNLVILLPQPSKLWNYRCTPLRPAESIF
jgi:hypothetical protein